jgi:hypothetical protein
MKLEILFFSNTVIISDNASGALLKISFFVLGLQCRSLIGCRENFCHFLGSFPRTYIPPSLVSHHIQYLPMDGRRSNKGAVVRILAGAVSFEN